jgi:hypothetical protein
MPKRIRDSNRVRDRGNRSDVQDSGPPVPTNISEYMAVIGRKGGKIGGKRRLTTLTKEQRKRIATNAARARWQKNRKQD